jgi:vitamin B12 transporter
LKNPSKKALAFVGSVSFGTLTTAKTANYRPGDTRQNLQWSGSTGKWHYLATLNTQQANGFSEAVPFLPTESPEADRMARTNALVKTGFSAGKHFSLQVLGTADRLLNAFDDTYNGLSTSDNPYNMSYINQYRVGINPRWQHKKGEIVLALGGTNTQRTVHQWNSWISAVDTYRYVGRQTSADLYAKHTINKALYVVGGLQYQFMDMSSDSPYGNMLHEQSRFILADPYATFVADHKGFGLNAGGRLNTHSLYGQNWVYNINPFYHVPNTTVKVMASISTAYITPSLYQLFDAYSGNAALAPERNRTVEMGAEASLAQKKIQLTAVLFQREENQSILYSDATYRYYNADGINKAKGMEVGFRFQPATHWSLQANYTFNELDEALQRLNPKHKFNGRLAWSRGRWSGQWQWQYVDKRMDLFGYPGTSVSLDAYKINHLMGQFELLPGRCKIFAQVTNVFDEAFTEVIGYATQGRNYRLGLQLTW